MIDRHFVGNYTLNATRTRAYDPTHDSGIALYTHMSEAPMEGEAAYGIVQEFELVGFAASVEGAERWLDGYDVPVRKVNDERSNQ